MKLCTRHNFATHPGVCLELLTVLYGDAFKAVVAVCAA